MAHRIVISNISGGEGKTSLTRELAFALLELGYRVALVDSDPQASLTKTLGFHDLAGDGTPSMNPAYRPEHTIVGVFETDPPVLGAPLNVLGLDVWVANDHLYRADSLIAADLTTIGHLREALNQIDDNYDFVLIDTKPGVSALLNAAVVAGDHLIIPISGAKGFENLDKIVKLVKSARSYSPNFNIRLFVPNRVRSTTNAHKILMESLQEYAAVAPIARTIRDSVTILDAQRERQPVLRYKTNADIAQDIRNVTEDLLVALNVPRPATPHPTATVQG